LLEPVERLAGDHVIDLAIRRGHQVRAVYRTTPQAPASGQAEIAGVRSRSHAAPMTILRDESAACRRRSPARPEQRDCARRVVAAEGIVGFLVGLHARRFPACIFHAWLPDRRLGFVGLEEPAELALGRSSGRPYDFRQRPRRCANMAAHNPPLGTPAAPQSAGEGLDVGAGDGARGRGRARHNALDCRRPRVQAYLVRPDLLRCVMACPGGRRTGCGWP
jgi:hypothetical protein